MATVNSRGRFHSASSAEAIMRPYRPLLSLAAPLVALACADDTGVTAPEVNTSSEVNTSLTVVLTAPAPEIRIPQNVPTLGCAPHAARGYGLRIEFSWSPQPASDEIVGYYLLVQREGSQYPLVSRMVDRPSYAMTSCNGFVIDANLEGWSWQVWAVDASGAVGPPSEARAFAFEPCRLEGGRPCYAPRGG